jgi:DNA-binding transcriptional regulator YiaG
MITEMNLSIPETISLMCERYGLTKAQIADKLHCTDETLRRWKRDNSYPEYLPDTLKGIELGLLKAVEINK